jgi:hypothetical protein
VRRCTGVALVALLAAAALVAGCSCTAENPPAPARRTKPPIAPALWPLLGTPAPSDAAVQARALSVKIENSPQARPQAGLAQADVVYEVIVEGGETRYNAIYHSKAPARVGPVRSARMSDLYIVPQYHAVFVRIGADFVVEAGVKATPNMDDLNEFKNPAPYHRESARQAPHNLYANLPVARETAVKRGYAAKDEPPGLEFGAMPSGGSTGTVVDLRLSSIAHVRWTWDAARKRYVRSFNGSRRGDQGANEPYQATNVVVLFAVTKRARALDPAGNPTYEETLAGTNKAVVFRDGKRFEGTWEAPRDRPPRFRTADGRELPFESGGQTWMQVVPTTFKLP